MFLLTCALLKAGQVFQRSKTLFPLPASFQQLKIPANSAVTNSRPLNIPHPMMLGRFHSPQIFLLNQRLL